MLMKCQALFSLKKKNIIKMISVSISALRVNIYALNKKIKYHFFQNRLA